MPSLTSVAKKVKSAATSYAKNVAGGAKIVYNAGKDKLKDSSLAANVLNATGRSALPDSYGQSSNTNAYQNNQAVQNNLKPRPTTSSQGNSQSSSNALTPGQFGGSTSAAPVVNTRPVSSRSSSSSKSAFTNLSDESTALMAGQFGGPTSFANFSSQGSGSLSSKSPSLPSSNVINTPTLSAQNTKFTFPEVEAPDYTKYIPPAIEQQEENPTTEKDNALKDYLKQLEKAPDSADAYAKAQRETDIKAKQQLVNDLTGQLNAVVNKGQANQLSLVGQGRGIPEAIIGGQQAQIGRETAIAALPIQAMLSAAQGNLEMANENLETLFKIYSEDAERAYSIRKEQKKMVYDIANEKEKRALEKLDKLEERAYKETQDLNDERLMYSKMAFANGQSTLGSKIAKLDYKSPTFRTDLATLSSQIVDSERNLRIQKLQQDLANSGTTVNPKVLATTQFKNAQSAQNLKLTLGKAISAVEKYGNYERVDATGKGILDTLKTQLRSEISTALEQGVVQPGEAPAFDQAAGELNSSIFTRNNKTLGSLQSLYDSMEKRIALQKAALTGTYNVTDEQLDTLLNITDLSDQEFADMDALID